MTTEKSGLLVPGLSVAICLLAPIATLAITLGEGYMRSRGEEGSVWPAGRAMPVVGPIYLGSDWKLLLYHLPLALFFAILLLVSWRSINTTGHSDEWRSAVTSENSEIEEEA